MYHPLGQAARLDRRSRPSSIEAYFPIVVYATRKAPFSVAVLSSAITHGSSIFSSALRNQTETNHRQLQNETVAIVAKFAWIILYFNKYPTKIKVRSPVIWQEIHRKGKSLPTQKLDS